MGDFMFFFLLIGSFVKQVSFLILMTFVLGPIGIWGMHFRGYFGGCGNKYKKSVGKNFENCKKKNKTEGHLGTNM